MFKFKRGQQGSEGRAAELEGPIGLWAFRLKERLGMKDENSSLRFTTSTTFYKNVLERPEEQAERIANNYQYVIMADEHRVGKTGRQGHEQMLDFCALHLIKRQVCIYPPLSLMYALSDKHRMRDPMLVDVMLPHVRMKAKATISESAEEAGKALRIKCPPERNLDRLVAKVNTSCSAMGVFFVNKEGGMWTTTNNGNKIGDDNGEDKNGIKIGEILRWEPYLKELQGEEWRMYRSMQTNYTTSGMRHLYSVQTELMEGGEIHVGKTPTSLVPGKTANQQWRMKILCNQTIDLLRKSEHTAWRSIQDLVFRFDVVLDGNEIYLNEIDVFPVALSFLDEYITCEDFLEKMVECTCKYMQDHSTNAEAWPM